MITYLAVPIALLAVVELLALVDRRRRRARVRAELREVRTRIRDQPRADITEDVAAMTHADITRALIGICQASAAAERTNHPTTTE
jgi:broad specificity phosphatase PhoE